MSASRDWFQYFQHLDIDNFPLFLYYYYMFREPTIGYIRKHVPQGGSIIEFGTGTALLGILLSAMGYDFLGVDSDPQVVEMAKRNNERLGGHAKIQLLNLFHAPKQLGRVFDLAYSEGVIEHYRGPEFEKALIAHRDLGRKVLLVVPSQDDPLVTDQDTYDFKSLERACRSVQLTPIDKYGMGTGIIKWPKLLVPPIVLKRLLGRGIKCENIGLICKSPEST